MTNGDKPVYITRGEFYSAITLIWVYIMLVTGFLLPKWQWPMGLLCMGSFVMVVGYSVKTLRSKRAQEKSGKSI